MPTSKLHKLKKPSLLPHTTSTSKLYNLKGSREGSRNTKDRRHSNKNSNALQICRNKSQTKRIIIIVIIITVKRTENVQLPVTTAKELWCFARQHYSKTVYINYSKNIIIPPCTKKNKRTSRFKNTVHSTCALLFVITDLPGLCTRNFRKDSFLPSETCLSDPGFPQHITQKERRNLIEILVTPQPPFKLGTGHSVFSLASNHVLHKRHLRHTRLHAQ